MGRGITARIAAVIREAVECGREEDGEADRWGRLSVGERALDGLAQCVAGWWACASENAAGFRGWKRAGALRGWSGPGERERGSRPGWAACWGGKGSWAREKGLGWVSWAGLWVLGG